MSTTNDVDSAGTLFSGLPWWLRGLAVIGFPALAAIYLMWLIGQALPPRLDAVLAREDEIFQAQKAHHDIFLQKWSSQEQAQHELVKITRALCVNAAKDEQARNRCLGQ